MMMMMTSIEESGKIHIPKDAALRVPGTPPWTDLAHGVHLT
jgi:hypothetical protein